MQDRITRSRMVGDPPDVLIVPRLARIGMLEFERAAEAIDDGYAAVERQLPEIRHLLKTVHRDWIVYLIAILNCQFSKNPIEMNFYRADFDIQFASDFFIG